MIRVIQESDIIKVKELIDSRFAKCIDIDSLSHTLTCEACKTFVNVSDLGEVLSTAQVIDGNRLAWVCAKYPRKGYTRELLQEIIKNAPNVHLYVKQSNHPAVTLYKSLGFKITGERESSFRMELGSS